jgi:hypothetical protein
MILYTVCNHSPLEVTKWLAKHNIAPKYTVPNSRSRGTFYLFGTVEYKSNPSIQQSSASIVLFCGPISAKRITNAHHLDIVSNNEAPYYGIQLTRLNSNVYKRAKHCEYTFNDYDYANTIIESVESKSLLGTLMTAIYTLPNPIQKPVKIAIIDWLVYDGRIKNLPIILERLELDYKLRRTCTEQLNLILQSELAQTYALALKSGTDAETMALDYEISAYDLNYIFNVKSSKQDYQKRYK